MAKGHRDLTEGNIKKQLLQLTWPMLMGMMGVVIFNLVDTYFVGKLGVKELAAMSFSFPVIMFLNSLSLGVGIGTSSLVARNIINTERSKVKMMASRAILLGVIVVMIFVVVGMSTIRPIFSALGAEGEVLDYVTDYMSVWYWSVPFVVIPMIGNNIVRATGNTLVPGLIMAGSSVVNVILDPIFIFGIGGFPEMGIKGAALATVFARATGLIAILYVLIKKDHLLTVKFGRVKEILATWKDVLYIAGPAALTMLITPISVGLLTKILAGFGKEAVAAFGVASRIEMFAMMVIMSLGSVLIIFVGQNLSKLKFDRIKKSLNYGLKFSISWGVFIFIVLLLFDEQIAGLFSTDKEVISIVKQYFYIIGSSYGFQGLVALSTSSFNGLNKPHPSAVFSIIRMLVLYVPLAWLGSLYLGIDGIFWAGFIANIIVGLLSFKYLHRTVKRLEESHL